MMSRLQCSPPRFLLTGVAADCSMLGSAEGLSLCSLRYIIEDYD